MSKCQRLTVLEAAEEKEAEMGVAMETVAVVEEEVEEVLRSTASTSLNHLST